MRLTENTRMINRLRAAFQSEVFLKQKLLQIIKTLEIYQLLNLIKIAQTKKALVNNIGRKNTKRQVKC